MSGLDEDTLAVGLRTVSRVMVAVVVAPGHHPLVPGLHALHLLKSQMTISFGQSSKHLPDQITLSIEKKF